MSSTIITLRGIVEILSFSPDLQVQYLRRIGQMDSVDELALQFDDLWNAGGDPIGQVPNGVIPLLSAIHSGLTKMSDESDCWTFDALQRSSGWEEIRQLSRKVLSSWPTP